MDEQIFSFSIGDMVTTREALSTWEWFNKENDKAARRLNINYEYGKPSLPIVLTVLERRLQECPGGKQIHYLCRYNGPTGYIEHLFNEIELVKHPALPVKTEDE